MTQFVLKTIDENSFGNSAKILDKLQQSYRRITAKLQKLFIFSLF